MAFRQGRLCEITVNAQTYTTYVDKADLKVTVKTGDTTVFGVSWEQSLPTIASATLAVSGKYDPTVAALLFGLVLAAPFQVIYYPGGNVSGQVKHTFNAILADTGESSPAGDNVTFSGTLKSTGSVVTATI